MLFDWNTIAAPAVLLDVQLSAPRTLTGEGLWVCLVSSGKCTASVPGAGPSPAGAALILPPQSVPAGEGEASVRLAVHLPLEIRQTHSPSPVRVRGAESCTFSSAAGAAMVFQSNSNI